MSKFLTAVAFGAVLLLSAIPGWCADLYEDPATGQLYTKPAEGRVTVSIPADKAGGLYEDESGAVFSKPGAGRTPVSMASQAAPQPQASPAEEPVADYSTQAFAEAVKHVISDEESTTYPKVKVGSLFYGEYFYDFDKETPNPDGSKGGRNKFTLNRGYINLRADMTPEIKARVTPDITRASNGDWELRLKYGYLEFHNFLDFYPSFDVKLGQYETAWLDYEEARWTYRVIEQMMIEKEGFFNSADLGVGLKGKLPQGYGDWQVDVINGEGYHQDEQNKFKTVQARLTLVPLPKSDLFKGLELTGFISNGRQNITNNVPVQRDRYIAYLGYTYHDDLYLAAEYDLTRGKDKFLAPPGMLNLKGQGFSTLAWYRMPFWKPIRILGRFDQFDHNTDDTTNQSTATRWIYGLSYDLGKSVMFVLNNERTLTGNNLRHGQGSKELDENLLKVDVQWKFN